MHKQGAELKGIKQVYKCQYFTIKELVSPIVYKQWGEKAWMFFDPYLLEDLDYGRESYGAPIIINNWANGGSLKQCGLRSNLDEIPKSKTQQGLLYLSAHTMGCGFDLHCGFGHHQKLYNHWEELIKRKKFKRFKRLENFNKTKTWVHSDSFQSSTITF